MNAQDQPKVAADSWLPTPPGAKSKPPRRSASELFPPDLARRVSRMRWWLLAVPFTFPMWIRLRRESPEAAEFLRPELTLCIMNSVAGVVLLGMLVAAIIWRREILDALAPLLGSLR